MPAKASPNRHDTDAHAEQPWLCPGEIGASHWLLLSGDHARAQLRQRGNHFGGSRPRCWCTGQREEETRNREEVSAVLQSSTSQQL